MKRLLSLLFLAGLILPSTTPAVAGVGSSFNLNCAYTRSLADDPIVYPDQPGVSHMHDFFGNRATDANSVAPLPNTTSCQNAKDPSAYWAPAAYVNGARVLPKNIKAYYIHQITGPIKAFPTGLKMLAGSGSAITPQPTTVVYYGCGSGTGISKVNYAPNCTSGNLQIHVIFPDCGTGALDSPDHRAHMAYSVGHVCPAGFGEHFPQLQMRLNYDVKDARTLQFVCTVAQPSCDPVTLRAPYYTVHGDFFNAWDPTELTRLIGTI